MELLLAVVRAGVRDSKLRDEATRAARGACLNIAEGAARVTRPDKARAFAIARGEAAEAAAALELAVLCGQVDAAAAARCAVLAARLVALLSGLLRMR